MLTRTTMAAAALLAAGAFLGWLAASGLLYPEAQAQEKAAVKEPGKLAPLPD